MPTFWAHAGHRVHTSPRLIHAVDDAGRASCRPRRPWRPPLGAKQVLSGDLAGELHVGVRAEDDHQGQPAPLGVVAPRSGRSGRPPSPRRCGRRTTRSRRAAPAPTPPPASCACVMPPRPEVWCRMGSRSASGSGTSTHRCRRSRRPSPGSRTGGHARHASPGRPPACSETRAAQRTLGRNRCMKRPNGRSNAAPPPRLVHDALPRSRRSPRAGSGPSRSAAPLGAVADIDGVDLEDEAVVLGVAVVRPCPRPRRSATCATVGAARAVHRRCRRSRPARRGRGCGSPKSGRPVQPPLSTPGRRQAFTVGTGTAHRRRGSRGCARGWTPPWRPGPIPGTRGEGRHAVVVDRDRATPPERSSLTPSRDRTRCSGILWASRERGRRGRGSRGP